MAEFEVDKLHFWVESSSVSFAEVQRHHQLDRVNFKRDFALLGNDVSPFELVLCLNFPASDDGKVNLDDRLELVVGEVDEDVGQVNFYLVVLQLVDVQPVFFK